MATDAETKTAMNGEFSNLEQIGEGTYGVVYKGTSRATNITVALKKITLDPGEGSEGVPSTAIREIALLRELTHQNVVRLYDIIHNGSNIYMVFEFVDMDLKKFFDLLGDDRVPAPDLVQSLTWQILQGLSYCHTHRVVHRDLKPQNLLLHKNGVLKIADFGLARGFSVPMRCYTHEVVTLWYRAPEVLLGSKFYTPAVDVWSVACIFTELVSKKVLFGGDSEIDQLFRIFRALGTPTEESWEGVSKLPDYKPTFPQWEAVPLMTVVSENMTDDALDLLSMMLVYSDGVRVSAREACNHRYFNGIVTAHVVPLPVTLQPTRAEGKHTRSSHVISDITNSNV